jgi:hypothetical protein
MPPTTEARVAALLRVAADLLITDLIVNGPPSPSILDAPENRFLGLAQEVFRSVAREAQASLDAEYHAARGPRR